MSEIISQSEFARRIKKTPQYVSKLIKKGKLNVYKQFPKGPKNKIKYEEAVIAIEANKRASNELGDKFNKEQKGKGAKKAALARNNGVDEIDSDVKNTSKAMQKARLLAEINNAKIKEIEYKKAVGELVSIKIVNQELAKVAEVIRTKLISLEDKLPPVLLVAENIKEIRNIVRGEVNAILEEFQELSKTAVTNYED